MKPSMCLRHYWSPELHVWARKQEEETIIYGAAQYGQYRGKEQMKILKQFLDKAVKND